MQVLYYDKVSSGVLLLPIDKSHTIYHKSNMTRDFKLLDVLNVPPIEDYVRKNSSTSNPPTLFGDDYTTGKVKRQGSIIADSTKIILSDVHGEPIKINLAETGIYDPEKTVVFPLMTDSKDSPIVLIANKDKVGLISSTTAWLKHHLLKKIAGDKDYVLSAGIHAKHGWRYFVKHNTEFSDKTIGKIMSEDASSYHVHVNKNDVHHVPGHLNYLYGFTYDQLNKMLPGKRKIPKNAKFFDNYEDYKKLENIYTNNTFIPYKTEDGKHGILLEETTNITGLDLDNIDSIVSTGKKTMFTAIHTKDNKVDIYMTKEGAKDAELLYSYNNIKSINRLAYTGLSETEGHFLMQDTKGNLKHLQLNYTTDEDELINNFEDNLQLKEGFYQSKVLLGGFTEEDAQKFLKENCK